MSELLEKIRSRGYWRVIIRPGAFVENRVACRSDLLPILEKTSVGFKMWGFPHVDNFLRLEEGPDWIGQEISWDSNHELWRFYQSGQFVHYFGMPEDWKTGPDQRLPSDDGVHRVLLSVAGVVVQLTEIFEFAARLSFTDAGDDAIRLAITVDNLRDHFLPLPDARILQASEPYMQYTADLSNIELVAQPKELSLKPTLELLRCFDWNPGISMIRDLQGEFLRNSPVTAKWV